MHVLFVPMRNRFPRLKLAGQRFGRLVAVKDVGSSQQKHRVWECHCDCGNIVSVPTARLRTGLTKSCGCLRKDTAAATGRSTNVKHGLEGTGVYRSWIA